MKLSKCSILLSCGLLLTACGGGSDGGSEQQSVSTLPPEQPTTEISPPGGIGSSLIFDTNADGFNDIVFHPMANSSESFNSMEIYLNDGTGQFELKQNMFEMSQLKGRNYQVFMAKINANQDDLIDIVTVEGTLETDPKEVGFSMRIHLYLANNDGSFSDATANISSETYQNGWANLTIADFDNDGFEDFIVGGGSFNCEFENSDSTCAAGTIYLNNGQGHFAPANITIVESSNGYTHQFSSLRYGALSTENHYVYQIYGLLAGDLNNNGKVDLISHIYSTNSLVPSFINQSTPGNLKFEVHYSEHIRTSGGALLDVNRDGFKDWITSASISANNPSIASDTDTVPLHVLINNGQGIFTLNDTYLSPTQRGVQHARAWIVDDFDSDGFEDLLIPDHGNDWRPYPGFANLLLMNRANEMEDITYDALSDKKSYTHNAAVGDINNDGYVDIFFNNTLAVSAGHVEAIPEKRLWINQGGLEFSESTQEL
ncbi:VCBS repeat-containing protein [Pseudoalteromonas haloplanktis]|uniref:VCBS repeat-containing protein n=1 Tax=Pseudoalteromonas haloplanktis TaxID=228 RepID=A0ABU1B9Y1_PSEHA|nr:VCBS repeat-containing protein [Pseudoalteromonas haloplanktis]MDQ9091145.1 VCBS repeat-containing protein [Pseudoalteromonas haloplanktis]